MKTVPYSIHVEEDVAHFLEQAKKRAGRIGSRGAYVSRAIRSYEEMIDDKQAMKQELHEMDLAINEMRTVARKAFIARNRFMTMFNQALRGETPKTQELGEWQRADKDLRAAIEDEREGAV